MVLLVSQSGTAHCKGSSWTTVQLCFGYSFTQHPKGLPPAWGFSSICRSPLCCQQRRYGSWGRDHRDICHRIRKTPVVFHHNGCHGQQVRVGYGGGLGEAAADHHGPVLLPEQETAGGEGGHGTGIPFLRNVRDPLFNTIYETISLDRAEQYLTAVTNNIPATRCTRRTS